MEIRKANYKDIGVIMEIYEELFENQAELEPKYIKKASQHENFIKLAIDSDEFELFLADEDGEILGFIIMEESETIYKHIFYDRKYAYIMDISVKEGAQNKGVGKKLVEAGLNWARDKKLDYVDLSVLSKNKNALEFYEYLGFQEYSRIYRYDLE